MKQSSIALLALLCVSCAQSDRSLIETDLKALARDLDSVKLGESLHINKRGASLLACGTINARNGFGGYTGWLPFMAWQGRYMVAAEHEVEKLSRCCAFVSAAIDKNSAPPWRTPGYQAACEGLATPFDFSTLDK